MTVLRHLISILLMPFMRVVAVPYWLLSAYAAFDHRWKDGGFIAGVFLAMGTAVLLTGFAYFAWCVILFAKVGKGTLAPWDPIRKLVAIGPHRHLRNPMISGVSMMLLGEALFSGSWVVGMWSLLFCASTGPIPSGPKSLAWRSDSEKAIARIRRKSRDGFPDYGPNYLLLQNNT